MLRELLTAVRTIQTFSVAELYGIDLKRTQAIFAGYLEADDQTITPFPDQILPHVRGWGKTRKEVEQVEAYIVGGLVGFSIGMAIQRLIDEGLRKKNDRHWR